MSKSNLKYFNNATRDLNPGIPDSGAKMSCQLYNNTQTGGQRVLCGNVIKRETKMQRQKALRDFRKVSMKYHRCWRYLHLGSRCHVTS